jgi:dynactin complex subunit
MKKFVLFLSLSSLFFSCKKEEVVPTDDNELITTVELIFTDANKKVTTFSFQDKDGDGKTPPEKFDKITLDKNMAYTMEIKVYDETKNPKEDITEQIKLESDVHLFVFKIDPSALFSLKAIDKDKNGLPIGLLSSGTTQNAVGVGKFNLILKHQPPVNGKAVKTGNEAGGSSDIDLIFDLSIK